MYNGQIFHLSGAIRLEIENESKFKSVIHTTENSRIVILEPDAKIDTDLRAVLNKYAKNRGAVSFESSNPPIVRMMVGDESIRTTFVSMKCPLAMFAIRVINGTDGPELELVEVKLLEQAEATMSEIDDYFE